MRMVVTIALAVAAAVACSSSSDKKTPDAASNVDAFQSTCGHPGDMGNELMIGKFCQSLSDCPQSAPLCSSLGDPNTHFCTRTCSGSGSGSAQCGTNTTCTCNSSNQCGCTPNACL